MREKSSFNVPQIQNTAEVKRPSNGFVGVPCNVRFDTVQSGCLDLEETVPPVFRNDTEVVHGSAEQQGLLAVQEEGVIPCLQHWHRDWSRITQFEFNLVSDLKTCIN